MKVKQVARFPLESTEHWKARIKKQEEDAERAFDYPTPKPLDMHDDVTEGPDFMRLANEAFFKGKSEGFNDGLRQGQLNAQDAVKFFQKELSDQMRRGGSATVAHALALVGVGAAITFGTLVALGMI